ncbi:MAG: glycosyltransferase family 39 protein [Planctomycetota bacterium]
MSSVAPQVAVEAESSGRLSVAEWTIGALFVLALAIRSYGLEDQCLTNDEIIEIRIANRSWSDIVFAADGFPPLHHLILKAALTVTDNEMAGRWLSMLYGSLTIPMIGWLAWRFADSKAAVFASGLLAINPLHVYFSQEGRSYALFFLFCVLSVWLYWRAIEISTNSAWGAFVVAAGLGGYVHYYFGFVLLALGIIWLRQAISTTTWRQGAVALALIAVAQLPLLMLLGYDLGCQQSMQQTFFSVSALGYTGWAWLTGFCLGPSLTELHEAELSSAIQKICVWIIPMTIVVLYWLIGGRLLTRKSRVDLLLLLIIPLAAACAAALQMQVSFNVRYVVSCLLPLIVWLAIALSKEPRRWLQVAICLILVAASATSLANRQFDTRYFNEQSRAAFDYIVDHSDDNSPVYTMSNYMGDSAEYFLPEAYEVIQLDDVGRQGEGLTAAIEMINQADGPYWIFYSRPFHGDPARLFRKTLSGGANVELMGSWPGVELYRGSGPLDSAIDLSLP